MTTVVLTIFTTGMLFCILMIVRINLSYDYCDERLKYIYKCNLELIKVYCYKDHGISYGTGHHITYLFIRPWINLKKLKKIEWEHIHHLKLAALKEKKSWT